ncbi:hypothetical protein EJ04DRAFT_528146 [Polyplosphaeria fusca]|uniref:C2H2-type domain-containing protein n=1 Tax=Polyplosphaeria fusca TaxID=682080 RepID=A0A9P4QQD4_9PLEO|nr:hypothetical protein EJ04DRAFT_528146 [Polyplosphaeria fusca]
MKEKKLEDFIFQLSYRRFNEIWHKVCIVAGFREVPYLYLLRVGVGVRLDKNPSKDQATKDHAFYDNDNNNDKKKELGALTELLRLLRSRLRALRYAWGKLKLADIRQQYFKEADRARALGKEPPRIERIVSNITAGTRALKSNSQTADQIFQHFVRKWNISQDDEDPGRYIDLLIAYSRGCSKAELDLWEDEYESQEEYNEDNGDEDDDDEDYDNDECDDHERIESNNSENTAYKEMEENWKCVICDLNFSSRKTLTSHFGRHKRAQYFHIKKPRSSEVSMSFLGLHKQGKGQALQCSWSQRPYYQSSQS